MSSSPFTTDAVLDLTECRELASRELTASTSPSSGTPRRRRRGLERVSAVTVHAPHGTIEVDVRDGRIGRGEWQLLCSKLGLVEARYALRAAGVEVADGGEKARAGQ